MTDPTYDLTICVHAERLARPGEVDAHGMPLAWRGYTIGLTDWMAQSLTDPEFAGWLQDSMCAALTCQPTEVTWWCHPCPTWQPHD